jgi:hypothetical protein
MSVSASPPTPRGAAAWLRERSPQAVALIVFIAGPGALLTFWVLGSWPTDRGLFYYRSATIGDALLLPLIIGILVAVLGDKDLARRADERRWTIGAALLGLAGGVTSQALWLADNSPQTNWTLPHAHAFNAPGWWHAAFLSLMSAGLAALVVTATLRMRKTREVSGTRGESLASSPWLGILFAAGLLLVGLIVFDGARGGTTDAGLASLVSLAAATVVALLALGFAFGRDLRVAAPNLFVGLVAASGVCAVAVVGLPTPPGVAITAGVSAAAVGLAVSNPLAARGPLWGRAASAGLILLGGAAWAFDLVQAHGAAAAGVLLLAAVLAVIAGSTSEASVIDRGLVVIAAFYVFGTLALADWLDRRAATKADAGWAVGAAMTLLDVLVIGLVRDRFRDFMQDAQARRRLATAEAETGSGDGHGGATWILLVAFALPALAALCVLFVIASPLLGTNKGTGGSAADLGIVAVTGGAASVLAAVGAALGWRHRQKPSGFQEATPVHLTAWSAPLLGLALLGWSVALALQFGHPLHFPAVAGVVAVVMAVLVAEDLINSTVRLQLARPRPSVWACSLAAAAVVGLGAFWLLTVGIWDGRRPASAIGAVEACGAVLLSGALIAGAGGVAIAAGLRTPHITEQPPSLNAAAQQMMYAAVIFIAGAIPFFAVGRVDIANLKDSGLATLASLGFMPALLGAFIWVLGNNARHGRFEQTVPPPAPISDAYGEGERAERANAVRAERLKWHVCFTNWLAGGLLAASLIWTGTQVV